MNALPTLRLGANGPVTSALGLGAMGMSDLYGQADDKESLATLHAAMDAGVRLIDTGDFYGMGHNELLIGQALRGQRRDAVQISVKFGALRDPAGQWIGLDARPAAVKNFVAYSLKRLGTDYIDIYRPARLDPQVPIEDTIGAIADLVKAGVVRHIGLSEIGADTLRRAAQVHPISDVQIEYSLISRGIEDTLLPVARELNVGITAYGVLSRGLISGHWDPKRTLAPHDFRNHSPRFAQENLAHNLTLVEQLRAFAAAKGATPAQVAIAWVRAQAAAQQVSIVPLVGARTRARLEESLSAVPLALNAADLAALQAAVPRNSAAGTRYAAAQMAMLDSEKRTA